MWVLQDDPSGVCPQCLDYAWALKDGDEQAEHLHGFDKLNRCYRCGAEWRDVPGATTPFATEEG